LSKNAHLGTHVQFRQKWLPTHGSHVFTSEHQMKHRPAQSQN
jgi:hypothetical protein